MFVTKSGSRDGSDTYVPDVWRQSCQDGGYLSTSKKSIFERFWVVSFSSKNNVKTGKTVYGLEKGYKCIDS